MRENHCRLECGLDGNHCAPRCSGVTVSKKPGETYTTRDFHPPIPITGWEIEQVLRGFAKNAFAGNSARYLNRITGCRSEHDRHVLCVSRKVRYADNRCPG